MNDVQQKAIKAADDRMRPALELYEQRCKLFYLVCLLSMPDLRRTCLVLTQLTPDELLDALGYAEGLAAWRLPGPQSGDAPEVHQGRQDPRAAQATGR